MEFHVLLSVLAITITVVVARSLDTKSETKSSMKKQGLIMRLPTKLEDKKTLIVDGVVDTTKDRLEIVIPLLSSNKKAEGNKNCSIIYDSRKEVINEEEYRLCASGEDNCSLDYPSFTLTLKRDDVGIQMNIDINNAGPRPILCFLKKKEDFDHIQFKQGLHGLKKFSMVFSN